MTNRSRFLSTLARAQRAFRHGVKAVRGREAVLVALMRRAHGIGLASNPEQIRSRLAVLPAAEKIQNAREIIRALNAGKAI